MYRNTGLGSWIARRARMTPERTALVYRDRRITYAQLDHRITRLARALQARGVDDGDRVAFLGDNHPAALETLFACGVLGAVAVPLHPGFDDATLAQVLADAEPSVVVVTPELVPALRRAAADADAVRWITTELVASEAGRCERLDDVIEAASDEPIDRAIGLDRACLLAFSSGTTGRTKGVVLTHGNVLFNALNVLTSVDYLRDDVMLTSAPLYRMGGLGFSLAVLLKGGACVVQERADAETSLALIQRHAVTVWFDAVAALQAVCASPAFRAAALASLRVCVTGGSRVPPELVAAFAGRGVCLQSGYGLTEAAPLVLMVDRDEVGACAGAAGRPALLCAVRVVDGELEDVAPGETGELLVHGPNVMDGYWRDPAATARAFVEDGWLRTGDAAVAGADGMITVVGRAGDALVIGGKRIHPAPVEDRLRRSGVTECAIVQAAPGARPEVFVVGCEDAPIDRAALLARCRAELGDDPEPALHVVRALPRNANGKLLRARLHAHGPLQLTRP